MSFDQISETEYKKYLKEIESLMKTQPSSGTKEGERLKLLALAVQNYEKNSFFFEKPTPVEAIKFRMTEMGLSQNDLIPYLGGKNRVSEILSQKRPLTLPMIKALNKYLGIPLEVLLQDEKPEQFVFSPSKLEFSEGLHKELQKKGWVKKEPVGAHGDFGKQINLFLKPLGGLTQANVLFRSSPQSNVRGTDQAAAFLWSAKVLIESKSVEAKQFSLDRINLDLLRSVAELSYYEKGPLLAQEELLKVGIRVVIVPHLSSTYIDGGTITNEEGAPVIGLSLRYDRLDSFWHTLMHELVHVYKHLRVIRGPFLDDSDIDNRADPIEKEADQIAREIFISKGIWRSSDALHFRTPEAIQKLASELHVHPAIIAGRIRFETKKFNIFTDLLGINTVRKLFGC